MLTFAQVITGLGLPLDFGPGGGADTVRRNIDGTRAEATWNSEDHILEAVVIDRQEGDPVILASLVAAFDDDNVRVRAEVAGVAADPAAAMAAIRPALNG